MGGLFFRPFGAMDSCLRHIPQACAMGLPSFARYAGGEARGRKMSAPKIHRGFAAYFVSKKNGWADAAVGDESPTYRWCADSGRSAWVRGIPP